MSMFRQLMLTIVFSTLTAFIGSFVVSTITARYYIETQLQVKNTDNATSLALSMSQQEKDEVVIDLLVSALFDSGHYQQVKVTNPSGEVIAERHAQERKVEAPDWFVRLFPIVSVPGQAQISDGWKQYGTITLVSQIGDAYKDLWNGAIKLFLWLLLAGLITGIVSALILRRLNKPLHDLVKQAQDISERRFTTLEEPKVPEVKHVVQALNSMVAQVKQMFEEEAGRLEKVRRQANHDPVTDLYNRSFFLANLTNFLNNTENFQSGMIGLVRLTNLNEINSRLGRKATDDWLKTVAHVMYDTCTPLDGVCGRLNGIDFAYTAPSTPDAKAFAQMLLDKISILPIGEQTADTSHPISAKFVIGTTQYLLYDTISELFLLLDDALAKSEADKTIFISETKRQASVQANNKLMPAETWRKALRTALNEHGIKLVDFSVVNSGGQLIHHECPVRIRDQDGNWLAAGDFMHMAERLQMMGDIDIAVIKLTLERLENDPDTEIAVNLSVDTITSENTRRQIKQLINDHLNVATRLWLEVPEGGIISHSVALQSFIRELSLAGCRVGIEHLGHHLDKIATLQGLGLHYIKVDGSFIRGIDDNEANKEFLKGVASLARNLGTQIIAEGVSNSSELAIVFELGFDGATGPGV